MVYYYDFGAVIWYCDFGMLLWGTFWVIYVCQNSILAVFVSAGLALQFFSGELYIV